MERTCGTCTHARKGKPQPGQVIGGPAAPWGECHRGPPQLTFILIGQHIAPVSGWPTVQKDEGCGGWAQKVDA